MHVVIAGGGYSAVAFVTQLLGALRSSEASLATLLVTIVEPRGHLGTGVAYSTPDTDHRINAPAIGHMARTDHVADFEEWFKREGGLENDPEALSRGQLFPRRRVFGTYLGQLVRPYQASGLLRHLRDTVVGLSLIERPVSESATALSRQAGLDDAPMEVTLQSGGQLRADLFIVATGHLPAIVPEFVTPAARAADRFVANPWQPERIRAIDPSARVLLIGTGLTAADAMATLHRAGHRGYIHAVSRRGLQPQPLPPAPAPGKPLPSIWERLRNPVPAFLLLESGTPTTAGLLRAVRARIDALARDGTAWYEPFDDLRDALHKLWPQLSAADQRRFQRHLKPWYDTYRYRMPPQTGEIVASIERDGRFLCEAARVVTVDIAPQDEPDGKGPVEFVARLKARGNSDERIERYDAVINCTGPASNPRTDPLLDSLIARGTARPHASGVGLDTNSRAALVNRQGRSNLRLRVIGPPAAGALGDSIGAVFICAHIERLVADLMESGVFRQ